VRLGPLRSVSATTPRDVTVPEHFGFVTDSNTSEATVLVRFIGGESGSWSVDQMVAVKGTSLRPVARVAILEGSSDAAGTPNGSWVLRGVTSHDRYVMAEERRALAERQPPLGRTSATAAALIPIRKSAAWWELAQDQRREIFEERSHHIGHSLVYIPRIARRLHHSRDLGEPFDFLTWFEFAPDDAAAFDELTAVLRATEEWTYVENEVEIRLSRVDNPS